MNCFTSSLFRCGKTAVLLASLVLPAILQAASATWTGAVSGTWVTAGNWAPSVPGSATNTNTSADVATFLNSVNTTVTVDATRALGGIRFNAGAGAFTFNSGAFYFLSPGGGGVSTSIVMASGVADNQTFNSTINGLRSGTGGSGFGVTNNSTSGTLIFNGGIVGNAGGPNSTSIFNIDGVGNGLVNGVASDSASGALSIIKVGSGTWTFTGANTFTGTTVAGDGTVALDFGGASSPTDNIMNASSLLTFGRGAAGSRVLSVVGKSNAVNTQTFGGFALTIGASHLNLAAIGSGSLTVNLGAMSATGRTAGQTFDIKTPAGTTVTTTTANATTGLLPQAVTLNGSDFATNSGSNTIVAFTAYTANTATSLGTSSQVIDMTGGNTTLSNTGVTQIGAVRFNTNAARTITLDPAQLLVVGQSVAGAILVTSAVGSNLTKISGGLLAGFAGRDLVILQNNTAGDLQIDSVITAPTSGNMGLTKSGEGKLILNGQNTYGGVNTFLNEGTTVVTADATVGNVQVLTTGSGSKILTGVNTAGLFIGQRVLSTNVSGSNSQGTFITAIGAGTVTMSLSATASGTSNVAFGNSGALGTTTGANAVQVGSAATLQIGNGGATGSLVAGQGILNAGTVAINHSNAFTFSSTVTGAGTVIHAGSGTTTMDSTSDYTGATTVNAGTLLINGAANSSAAMVNNGGQLGGTGSVGSVTVNAGGAMTPGSGGIGTLATNNGSLVWNGEVSGAFGQMKFELSNAGNTSDQIALGTGMLDKNTGNVFSFDFQGTGLVNTTYTLITFGSTDFLVGDFSYTGLASGLTGSFVENAGSLQFVTTAVPEPSVIALAGLGVGLVLWRMRRRAGTQSW